MYKNTIFLIFENFVKIQKNKFGNLTYIFFFTPLTLPTGRVSGQNSKNSDFSSGYCNLQQLGIVSELGWGALWDVTWFFYWLGDEVDLVFWGRTWFSEVGLGFPRADLVFRGRTWFSEGGLGFLRADLVFLISNGFQIISI